MNTPKPHPPMSATKRDEVTEENMASLNPSEWIVNAMKEQLEEIRESQAPKPKASKPKGPYFPKNRPLAGHSGLVALKAELEANQS